MIFSNIYHFAVLQESDKWIEVEIYINVDGKLVFYN